LASITYTSPGIYNIRASVQNNAGQRDEHGRRFIALGKRDLLSNSLWARMALGDTLKNGDTLRIYLTVLDTQTRIIAGPVNTSEPGNLTQPQESLFYGVFQYQNGVISACDGSPCAYNPAPGTYGAGTYELVFVLHGTATALNTYSLYLYDNEGNPIHQWENLTRRGFAQSGQIVNYATWASRDHAAVAHMEPWEDQNAGIASTRKTSRRAQNSPIVASRRNGISISIPASARPAQIEFYNAKGALVKRVPADGKAAMFVPMMSRGLYLYRINAGGGVFRGSVVVR
jgi:hypothetical protein